MVAGRLAETYTAVSTEWSRLRITETTRLYGVLDDGITNNRSREACVEVGCVGQVDVITTKQILVSTTVVSHESSRQIGNEMGLLFFDKRCLDVGFQPRIKGLTVRDKLQK